MQDNQNNKLHLSWDGDQNNGIIFNEKYPWGALYKGEHLKPDIGVDYKSFNYSEVFNDDFSRILDLNDGTRIPLDDLQISLIKGLASEWIQESGQEGNPTKDQIEERNKMKSYKILKDTQFLVSEDTSELLTASELQLVKKYRQDALKTIKDPSKEIKSSVKITNILNKFGIM